MGYTHCFRANAAYSLYGVLKGNSDDGCTSGTYINSFFTNYGVDAFEPVMEAAGVFSEDNEDSYTAECQDGDDDDGNDGNDADGGGYGGGTSYANKGDNMGSTSYGMSCNGNQFVTKKFRGRYCDGKDEIKVTNLLESFNEAIEQVECVQVYSGSNGDNNGDGGSIASDLLSYSKACSIREFPSQCPDPFGKLLKYTRTLECATGTTCLLRLPEARLGRDIASVVLLLSGLAMIGAACCCKWHRKRGKSQMEFIRESSDASKLSTAIFLSKVSSSFSYASSKVADAIQDFAEAEAPRGMGMTVEMEMATSNVSRSGLVSGSPSPVQAQASNMSTPDSTRLGLVHTASGGQASVGFNEAIQTPTRNVASLPSAAEAVDSTPSTVATFQSIQSAEDRKMAATSGPPTYGPPSTRAVRSRDDEAIAHMRIDEEVANNMLADKEMEKQKSYKRPTLARISKRLFGGRKKKVNKKVEL
jgi:hypothetical protein